MATISANLQAVRDRIARAAEKAGRDPSSITLVAVSKTWPAEYVFEAWKCGQRAFGENHVQEAVRKIAEVQAMVEQAIASPQAGPLLRPPEWHAHDDPRNTHDTSHRVLPSSGVASPQAGPLLRPPEWHFLGPIQSNKTRAIAQHFEWVHSIDREKVAVRLNAARPEHLPAINVCIQVNVSGETSKSGVAPGEELALARAIATLPRLRLRGLMAIPEPTNDVTLQRSRFALLRRLKDGLVSAGFALDTLSMGMSDDFEAAILEGATLVRIGTAIFGRRKT
jgi:uncharacterized pyridoxal phosphate-containing UPF0001 family protein